jgi:hypothetical protein
MSGTLPSAGVPDPGDPNPDALYLPLEDGLFQPTFLTRGPWSPDSQHGGPAAALVARASDRVPVPDDGPMQVARLTLELLRPVPLSPLRVETTVSRPGRKVQVVESSVFAGELEVLRGRALRMRVSEEVADAGGHVPPEPMPAPVPPPPAEPPPQGIVVTWEGFHNAAMDIRFVEGAFAENGPGAAWFRLTVPLVAGEPITPLTRLMGAADFGNGISRVLDSTRHLFINPDLTVHVARLPEGEWVALRSTTTTTGHGIGMAESALFDERGRIGRAVQSLLLDRR